MCDCDITSPASIPYWLVAARALHFAACLLVIGICAFDRFAAGPIARQGRGEPGSLWRFWNAAFKAMILLSLAVALASGAAWYLLVVKESFWEPAILSLRETVQLVWSQTEFGKLSQLRSALWIASAVTAFPILFLKRPSRLRSAAIWLVLLLGAALTATLSWAGHGQEGSGNSAPAHLAADVMHLLASGFWPAGLLPFGLLLFKLRRVSARDKWLIAADVTRRYSAVSLASVALLTATGLVNSWFLVGSWAAFYQTGYGRVLLLKVGLFSLMVLIGAVNLLFLKPRLSARAAAGADADGQARGLQSNMAFELFLSALVIAAVAFLGVLPPAVH